MVRIILTSIIFTIISLIATGQTIGIYHPELLTDNTFSIKYENDWATKTDYYYTQGVQIAFTHPAIGHFPVSRLLLQLNNNPAIYGISIEHNGYTPTSIESDSILYGDRPFAASIMLHNFAIFVDAIKHARLSTQLTLGLLGPGAGGKEIQTEIHRNTPNALPHGWQYQIANDVILNYYLRYDRSLFHAGKFLYLDALGGATIGTYSDKAFAGVQLTAGLINNQLFAAKETAVQCYISYQPQVNLIGYDATLQGGLFNKESPYTISSKDIERLTIRQELMASIGYKRLLLSANATWLSKEFKTGMAHAWGGLQLAWHF